MGRRGATRTLIGLGVVMAALAAAVVVTLVTWGEVEQQSTGRVVPVAERHGSSSEIGRQRIADSYGALPLAFAENRGQTDDRVRYLAQGARYGFFLTPESLVMSLLDQDGEEGVVLSLGFVGANPDVTIDAARPAAGTVTYLRGDGASPRSSGLSTFRDVIYRDLWPGIDMIVRGGDGVLKYEFRAGPGASTDQIELSYEGADGLAVDGDGALAIDTAIGSLRDSAPVSYQVIDGERVPVESRYALDDGPGDEQRYGFAVGDHDRDRELVIDPGLAYSTFLGGLGNQHAAAIEVDAEGNAYVTGFTQSPTFPTTPGAFDRNGSFRNDLDAFVSKLDASGTGLVYSTFLGGSNFEWGRDLAIDADGSAYVTGQTKSSNFPTTGNAFDPTINTAGNCPRCGIDVYDAFVTKLNPQGSGARLLDVPRRTGLRRRHVGRRRRVGQGVRGRPDRFQQFPDPLGVVRHQRERHLGRVRHQVQRERFRARLLHLLGRNGHRGSERDRPRFVRQRPDPLRHRAVGRLRHEAEPIGLGPRVLDVRRRGGGGQRRRRRARRGGQRLPVRRHVVTGLRDDPGHLRHHVRRDTRVVRRQAESDGHRIRLSDLPRQRRSVTVRRRGRRKRLAGGCRVCDRVHHPGRGAEPVRRGWGRRLRRQARSLRLDPRVRHFPRRVRQRARQGRCARPGGQRVHHRGHPLYGRPDDRRRTRPRVQRRFVHQRLRLVRREARDRPRRDAADHHHAAHNGATDHGAATDDVTAHHGAATDDSPTDHVASDHVTTDDNPAHHGATDDVTTTDDVTADHDADGTASGTVADQPRRRRSLPAGHDDPVRLGRRRRRSELHDPDRRR